MQTAQHQPEDLDDYRPAKRTDVHRPGSPDFDPAKYVLRGVFDLRPPVTDPYLFMEASAQRDALNRVIAGIEAEGFLFRNAPHGRGQCGHCGAHLRYAALMTHAETHALLCVGEECLDNRFSLSKDEFQHLRETARLNKERATKAEQFQQRLAEVTGDARVAYEWALTYPEHLREANMFSEPVGLDRDMTPEEERIFRDRTWRTALDLALKLEHYPLSEKQQAFLVTLHQRHQAAAQRRAQEAADLASGKLEPCPAGKQTLRGEVLSTKWVDNDFGGTLKMTLRDDRGFRVYGSVPSCLQTVNDGISDRGLGRGDRVEFRATVEPKASDPTFGFYSRPSGAQLLELAPPPEPAPAPPPDVEQEVADFVKACSDTYIARLKSGESHDTLVPWALAELHGRYPERFDEQGKSRPGYGKQGERLAE